MNEVEKLQNKNIENGTESDSADTQSEKAKYLTFWTDGELFGIPIQDVVQITGMQKITPLPDFPDYAKGVINLRGNIIPVIDMRVRLKRPETVCNDNTCMVVTSVGGTDMAFIVDAVDEVAEIDRGSIAPPPKVAEEITNRYLTGIGQIGSKVVLLLDVSKILSESILDQLTKAEEQTEGKAEKTESAPDGSGKNEKDLQPVQTNQ